MLLWFRRDLRLTDNPALNWAAGTGRPVIPVFVLDDEQPGIRPLGGASRWWLHGSLDALRTALRALGSRLILRRGAADAVLAQLVRETGATDIVWNRLYDPDAVLRDKAIKARCIESGVAVQSFNAGLLFEPWTIRTGQGSPYRVFTLFWRRCLQDGFDGPGEGPSAVAAPTIWPNRDELDDWGLRCSTPDWAAGLRAAWRPGEAGARMRLDAFLTEGIEGYHEDRDLPGAQGTSRLSPHLHFGEIGPRQVAGALKPLPQKPGKDAFLRELGWREFSHHLLHHNPGMATANLRSEFDRMPWREDPAALRCWQRGWTGYPFVDAGMRELWATGWMHNRVRMVAASFLTRHLLLDWRLGEDWFWDTLVDADWGNNSVGWQWVAGCGADAAPYFRIFNPVAQSRRYDPTGRYLRAWLPELARLPDDLLHAPWKSPPAALEAAGVRLGTDYPHPLVDHAAARRRALHAYRRHVAADERRNGVRPTVYVPLFPRPQTTDMISRWCRVAFVLEAAALSDDAAAGGIRRMRMFTITYDSGGRIATATVQGTEITTTDESLCICEDGTPLATFPKQSVLHVTSNSPGDNRPAPAVDELGMPLRSLHNARVEGREDYWRRLRTALDPTPPHGSADRVVGRKPTTGGNRRGYVGGVHAAGPGDAVPSSGARAR